MAELILGVSAVLGSIFIMCKLIGKTARIFGLDEITSLMGKSLALRTGDLSSGKETEKTPCQFGRAIRFDGCVYLGFTRSAMYASPRWMNRFNMAESTAIPMAETDS